MTPSQIEAYLRAVDTYLKDVHEELSYRFSVYEVDPPPRVEDYS